MKFETFVFDMAPAKCIGAKMPSNVKTSIFHAVILGVKNTKQVRIGDYLSVPWMREDIDVEQGDEAEEAA